MFITFEGIEGSGKSTQIALLDKLLESRGIPTLLTREPGGSYLGQKLRQLLLHLDGQYIAPPAELFLYLADRAQHVDQTILPALKNGKCVLSDRFTDSTIVYQGYGRKLDSNLLHIFNKMAVGELCPDLTLLLDLPAEISMARARARNLCDGKHRKEERYKNEALGFHDHLRKSYLTLATLHYKRIRVIPAQGSQEDVFESVKAIIEPLFPTLYSLCAIDFTQRQ